MARWGFDVSRPTANLQTPGPFFFKWVRFEPTAHLDRRANRLQFVDPYPLLQIPTFLGVSCLLKKEVFTVETQVFSKIA